MCEFVNFNKSLILLKIILHRSGSISKFWDENYGSKMERCNNVGVEYGYL